MREELTTGSARRSALGLLSPKVVEKPGYVMEIVRERA
jgi:hypothetical protein